MIAQLNSNIIRVTIKYNVSTSMPHLYNNYNCDALTIKYLLCHKSCYHSKFEIVNHREGVLEYNNFTVKSLSIKNLMQHTSNF